MGRIICTLCLEWRTTRNRNEKSKCGTLCVGTIVFNRRFHWWGSEWCNCDVITDVCWRNMQAPLRFFIEVFGCDNNGQFDGFVWIVITFVLFFYILLEMSLACLVGKVQSKPPAAIRSANHIKICRNQNWMISWLLTRSGISVGNDISRQSTPQIQYNGSNSGVFR